MSRLILPILCIIVLACSQPQKPAEQANTAAENPPPEQQLTALTAGDYTTADNTGTLTITNPAADRFDFSIDVVTENANCTGELRGTAIADGDEWRYADEETGCTLTFERQDNTITVTEQGTCDHGATCAFGGTYQGKPNDTAPVTLTDIMDYYLALPDEYFNCEMEGTHNKEKRLANIVYKNVANGFLKVKSDELDNIALALFKNKDNGKLYLAFVYECGGGCACIKRHFLTYENGTWTDVYDKAFPDLSSLTEGDTNIALRLPEKGTTILVYNFDNPDKVLGKLSWSNGSFTLEKQ